MRKIVVANWFAGLAALTSLCAIGAAPAVSQEEPAQPPLAHYDEAPLIQSVQLTANESPRKEKERPKTPWPLPKEKYPFRLFYESGEQVPWDPSVDPNSIRPTGPETRPRFQNGRRAGPGDFVFYQDNSLSDADTGNPSNWPREPSVATFGRTILYTGNTFGALSTDKGATWTNINPDTEFNVTDVCCDQVAYYERTRGVTIWLMQGDRGGNNENVYYLAAFVGQKNLANLSWIKYTLDPQAFGYAAGVNWDFPELTCSGNYVWFTTNASSGGAIMVRADLDDFVNGGTTTFQYAQLAYSQVRLIQGASTVMYAATHVDTNTMRVYRWPETGTIDGVDRNIAAWNNGNSYAPGPDGRDWFGSTENATHKIRGATATGTTLFFLWSAAQGGGYPYPQARIAEFTRSDARTYIQTEVVWSNNTAWAYGAGHANDRGHLGGVIAFGGGDYYPSSAAWIGDDYNAVDLQPLENLVIEFGNYGPTGDRWGDYLTARRHVPYGNTWVGSAFTLEQGAGSSSDICTYTWFGRERDRPPTYNTIYVDLANLTGYETGESLHPFNTPDEGHFATSPGDTVIIQAGTYTNRFTLNRNCLVKSQGGSAVIR